MAANRANWSSPAATATATLLVVDTLRDELDLPVEPQEEDRQDAGIQRLAGPGQVQLDRLRQETEGKA